MRLQQGHKLVMWHGWADQIIMPQGSIDYYNQVTKTIDGGDVSKTQDWFRFFTAPGSDLHHTCACFLYADGRREKQHRTHDTHMHTHTYTHTHTRQLTRYSSYIPYEHRTFQRCCC